MEQPTDQPIQLETSTSVETLESLAYRQVVVIEQAQNNLRAIQSRISQLQKPAAPEAEVVPPRVEDS